MQAEALLIAHQSEFGAMVEELFSQTPSSEMAQTFDARLRAKWPLAEVGFVVTLNGNILSPLPSSRPEALSFCADNSKFLTCRESAEVFWGGNNSKQMANNAGATDTTTSYQNKVSQNVWSQTAQSSLSENLDRRSAPMKSVQPRNVITQQQQIDANQGKTPDEQQTLSYSKLASSEAEFCQLI